MDGPLLTKYFAHNVLVLTGTVIYRVFRAYGLNGLHSKSSLDHLIAECKGMSGSGKSRSQWIFYCGG